MHDLKVIELMATLVLAIACAVCAHKSCAFSGYWTRAALAALAVTSMLRFGALLAPMFGAASISPELLQAARSAAPALCAVLLLGVMMRRCGEKNNPAI